jgi:hypothetical protein
MEMAFTYRRPEAIVALITRYVRSADRPCFGFVTCLQTQLQKCDCGLKAMVQELLCTQLAGVWRAEFAEVWRLLELPEA